MKYLLILFISIISICCSHNLEFNRQIDRKLSSVSLIDSNCGDSLNSLVGPKTALTRHKNYLKKSEHARAHSKEEHNNIARVELGFHLTQGNQQYLKNNDEFIFNDKMKIVNDLSGVRHSAAFKVQHEGESLFIKEVFSSEPHALVKEITNSKIVYELGLGPRTTLVKMKGKHYLVMEEVSGINIKEVLYPELRTKTTKKEIDHMLGIETQSIEEAIQLFTTKLLTSNEYIARFAEIEQILQSNGFHSVPDLQFMIDFNQGPKSIQLIDVEFFERNDHITPSHFSPTKMFAGILDLLVSLTP